MLTIPHMYLYITQSNSMFGAGSMREHCIIMIQKSFLPSSASAADTEPAGLSIKGWGDADCGLCASDWREGATIRLPSLTTPVETWTQWKSFIPYLCTPVLFLSFNFSFTVLDFLEEPVEESLGGKSLKCF